VSRFSGVRLWAVITLQTQWYRDRSVKVGHEIKTIAVHVCSDLSLHPFMISVPSRHLLEVGGESPQLFFSFPTQSFAELVSRKRHLSYV